MRPVFAENDILALNLVDYLVTGENKLAKVNIKGDPFRPFDKIMALEAKRQVALNEQNKKIDEEIQKLNKELEDEIAKLNKSMQQKQRDAQVQLREKSMEIQKQLEPFMKYMKPDGSISLDRQKDKDTIDKLMSLQNEMGKIRQQVQADTRAAIMEMQKQIQAKQEVANEEIEKLEKQKRKDRKEGREDIEALEMRVQLANMLIMPIIVIAVGIAFFSKRRNQRA
jgi:DNA repair exonuclease SbcCD ATPase subunit